MDRDSAKTLATAGQAATQALGDQAEKISSSLNALPTVVSIRETLICDNVLEKTTRTACIAGAANAAANTKFEDARQKLLNTVSKRGEAIKALNNAYAAFGELAADDTGKKTADAMSGAFSAVNNLSSSLGVFGVAIPAITATVTQVVSAGAAFIADARQAELTMAASKDLHTATDTLIKALRAERDLAATKSLMSELEKERNRLEVASLNARLASPMSVLAPFYAKMAPDITLVSVQPARNPDVAIAAAHIVLKTTTDNREAATAKTYDQALTTLAAVSTQHQKLENNKGVDITMVIAEIQRLRDFLK
jgi:hypothetical protein